MLLHDPSWTCNTQIVFRDLLRTVHQMTIMYLNISLEIITNHYGIFWFGACEFTGLQENVLMWFLIWFLCNKTTKKPGLRCSWQEEHVRKVHWLHVWILLLNKLSAATDQTWEKSIIYCIQYGSQNLPPPTRIMSKSWSALHALSFLLWTCRHGMHPWIMKERQNLHWFFTRLRRISSAPDNLRYKRILLHLFWRWLETWISICLDISLTSLRQKLGYVFEDIQMENTGCDTWKNIHWNDHWWWCPLLCLVREGFSPSASLWKYHRLMLRI